MKSHYLTSLVAHSPRVSCGRDRAHGRAPPVSEAHMHGIDTEDAQG